MPEERFDRIEQTLGRIEAAGHELGSRVDAVHHELGARIDTLGTRIDALDGRIDTVHHELGARIDAVQQTLGSRIADVDRHMHVLHEDVVGKIRAVAEYASLVEEKMDRGFAEMKEAIAREIDPLKTTVRRHSVEIDQLKRRGG